jgi:hypothetical protein
MAAYKIFVYSKAINTTEQKSISLLRLCEVFKIAKFLPLKKSSTIKKSQNKKIPSDMFFLNTSTSL